MTRWRAPEVTALLERVALGEFPLRDFPVSEKEGPCLSAAACLFLARDGSGRLAECLQKLESSAPLDAFDQAALVIARSLAGERGKVDAGVLGLRSFTLGFAALVALERENTGRSLGVIIEAGIDHAYAAIRDESLLAVERMSGQTWSKAGKTPLPSAQTAAVQVWWAENAGKFVPRRAADQ